jgi:ABC-type uncharacterized transport system permease subunit
MYTIGFNIPISEIQMWFLSCHEATQITDTALQAIEFPFSSFNINNNVAPK